MSVTVSAKHGASTDGFLNSAWGGHYRGSNATEETVICPLSFVERRPLATVCAQGWNVRESSRLIFWASDLLHRLYHVPAFGQGYIDHYAEGYEGIIDAAASGSPNTTRDSDGLQYFALDSFAYDIIAPGEGCPGPSGPPMDSSTSYAASSPTVAASTTSVTAASGEATATESALPDNCHSHDDGSIHCT